MKTLLRRAFFLCVAAGIAWSTATAAEPAIRAQLTARRYAVLSAEIGARVRELRFHEGSAFKAGDTLVVFDDSLQRSQVARAEAVLSAAQRTFAANQRLLTLKSVGQIEVDLSEAEVEKARAELAYASAMLSKCSIVAPFSGRVSDQKVREQEFVQPGQSLFEIIDDAVPEIDFIAPSKWLAWIHVGQALEVKIEETGRSYPATVEEIGAKVDPVSQSVKIVAGIPGSHPELIAGMSGTINVVP
jgi:RND family efflux transporter MFP subunit